jgi:hypothetical protein
MEEPQKLADMPSRKRIPSWENELMRDAKGYGAP